MAQRSCIECRATLPGNARSIVCGPVCRKARQKREKAAWRRGEPATVVCNVCGLTFQRSRSGARHRVRVCSPECKRAAARLSTQNYRRGLTAKGLCASCGGAPRAPGKATCTRCGAAERPRALKRTYGMTGEQYAALLAAQGGRCAICRTDTPGRTRSFAVDHDHTTGKVRGLLCRACNTGIGCFRDSPERLGAALRYVRHHAQLRLVAGG